MGEPPGARGRDRMSPGPTGSAHGQAPSDLTRTLTSWSPHCAQRPEKRCHLPLDKALVFTTETKMWPSRLALTSQLNVV